jgi:hypothetical protein
MIFAASWALSSRLYGLAQRFCPSSIVIRRVHTRSGIKWGLLVGLAGAAFYGLLMVATSTIVRDGGPGWVNLFFIIGFWNTCRFTFLIRPRWFGCCGSATRKRCCCVTGSALTPPTPLPSAWMPVYRPLRRHEHGGLVTERPARRLLRPRLLHQHR